MCLLHGSLLIFQQTGHLSPAAFFVITFISSESLSIISTEEVIHNSDRSIPSIFLILSFYSAYYFRNEFYGDYLYFIMIILICVFTDIGGYIFGNFFKGPKLTKISPKKTYSGVIGGYLFSIIFLS